MTRFADMLNVDPDEHTCTLSEYASAPDPQPPLEVDLLQCGACGRNFQSPIRCSDHLVHAHGWSRAKANEATGSKRNWRKK